MLKKIIASLRFSWENRLDRTMLHNFDWVLFILVISISLFGIVCIFSATSSEVTELPNTVMEMIQTQSTYYPSQQFLWLLAGIFMMFVFMFPPYKSYYSWSTIIYLLNIGLLVLTLIVAEAGRGGMQAFVKLGSSSRGFQSSELGKIAMIICFSKIFAERNTKIMNWSELIAMGIYMGIPALLIILQPDVGTALVYIAVFAVLTFVSGTDKKLLFEIGGIFIILIVTVWYAMNNTSSGDNFRLTRILIWLDPESYPDEARQVINAQIAIGSGGLTGKGIISAGSFASLGYISDDHTDFIFAVVCEAFGLVGGFSLVIAYMLLIGRLIYLATQVHNLYGQFLIISTMSMLLFHIIENLCMVIGLLPVTGIPLPFVSYGGSNMMANMSAIGIVQNVVIRERAAVKKKMSAPIPKVSI